MTSSPALNEEVTADAALCPYTLKPISSIDKSDLAIINPTSCRHMCSLPHLLSYIHDASAGTVHNCPVCLQFKVTSVCDGNADRVLHQMQEENDGRERKIVCVRYGPIHYYLSLQSSSSRLAPRRALLRIGEVLGVDIKNGIKIIHNGKIIYPGDNTSNDISDKILSISSLDIAKKRRKPSLVVMGMRKQKLYANKNTSSMAFGIKDLFIATVSLLTPGSLLRFISYGFGWTINATKSLLRGVFLFVQSILYPPQHRD